MTILKDISDTLKDAVEIAKEMDIKLNKQTSIAKLSSAATLQFPIISSRSINVDTTQTVVKALERQYAIFVQMVISMNPYLDLEKDRNLQGYLKNIHQNNVGIIDLKESAMSLYSDDFGRTLLFSLNEGCNGQVLASNREQMFNPEEYLNNKILNNLYASKEINLENAMLNLDYYYKKNPEILTEKYIPTKEQAKQAKKEAEREKRRREKEQKVKRDREREFKIKNNIPLDDDDLYDENGNFSIEKAMDPLPDFAKEANNKAKNSRMNKGNSNVKPEDPNSSYHQNNDYDEEDPSTKNESEQLKKKQFAHQKMMDRHQMRMDIAKNELSKQEFKFQQEKEKAAKERQERMDNHKIKMDEAEKLMNEKKFKHELQKTKWDYQSKTAVKLSDNDVKKCNELVPTTLSLTLQVKDGSNFGGVSNFVIGVKGLLHPVNSDDMISNLLSGYKSGNKFFNFLRWTSGEIKFIKDLILNMDNIREDVVKKHAKNGSGWWSALKRRRNVAALRRIKGSGRILPNTTIVCSINEIDELKEAYGVDLMNPTAIKKIMKTFFLLGFVVVDDSQELCHFIFDGENNYQVVSFNGLEKENNSKNDFKDIYKLINSGRL